MAMAKAGQGGGRPGRPRGARGPAGPPPTDYHGAAAEGHLPGSAQLPGADHGALQPGACRRRGDGGAVGTRPGKPAPVAELGALHTSRRCCLQDIGCPAATAAVQQGLGLGPDPAILVRWHAPRDGCRARLHLSSLGPLDRPFCQGRQVAGTAGKLAATRVLGGAAVTCWVLVASRTLVPGAGAGQWPSRARPSPRGPLPVGALPATPGPRP